jgi:hypothetical protein
MEIDHKKLFLVVKKWVQHLSVSISDAPPPCVSAFLVAYLLHSLDKREKKGKKKLAIFCFWYPYRVRWWVTMVVVIVAAVAGRPWGGGRWHLAGQMCDTHPYSHSPHGSHARALP